MIHGPARRVRLTAPLVAALLALLSAASACAQPGGGGSTASGSGRALPTPDSVLARAARGREKGAAGARVSVVEISDFQCPFCRQFYETTYHRFDSAYVKTGKVQMVYIHLPLPMHTQAYPAAEAAMCAGAQGKFWEMHDRLFATQREWGGQADAAQRFAKLAVELNLDAAAYRDCVDNDRTAPLILNDAMQASGAGVNGTPAFIVNRTQMLNGAVTFEQLSAAVDAALNGQTPPGAAPAPPAPARP
ncbi:MAG TPA: thioredoxin domain-containing protein [Longimicrobium sp.]|jgi:protein-disulfide isomerase|nr:thioredoxin domain-containing protein [Longimicrobium sp.]